VPQVRDLLLDANMGDRGGFHWLPVESGDRGRQPKTVSGVAILAAQAANLGQHALAEFWDRDQKR
jgi:hypothetical protein